ncbi:helix-turn-helix domain-containing protein [bacterium]|nr:helix-turn-helix domain-containing protein [bacterium]
MTPISLGRLTLFPLEEVAELLGISEEAVKTMIQEGKLRGNEAGGRWFVSESSLTRYFDKTPHKKRGKLAGREEDVFQMLEQGKTITEIAELYNVSWAGMDKFIKRNDLKARVKQEAQIAEILMVFIDNWPHFVTHEELLKTKFKDMLMSGISDKTIIGVIENLSDNYEDTETLEKVLEDINKITASNKNS